MVARVEDWLARSLESSRVEVEGGASRRLRDPSAAAKRCSDLSSRVGRIRSEPIRSTVCLAASGQRQPPAAAQLTAIVSLSLTWPKSTAIIGVMTVGAGGLVRGADWPAGGRASYASTESRASLSSSARAACGALPTEAEDACKRRRRRDSSFGSLGSLCCRFVVSMSGDAKRVADKHSSTATATTRYMETIF